VEADSLKARSLALTYDRMTSDAPTGSLGYQGARGAPTSRWNSHQNLQQRDSQWIAVLSMRQVDYTVVKKRVPSKVSTAVDLKVRNDTPIVGLAILGP
jgi:hypothetical protein